MLYVRRMKNLSKSISFIALSLLVLNSAANAQNLMHGDQEENAYRSEQARLAHASDATPLFKQFYAHFAGMIGIGKTSQYSSNRVQMDFSETHSTRYIDPTVSYGVESASVSADAKFLTLVLKPTSGVTRNPVTAIISRIDGGAVMDLGDLISEIEETLVLNGKRYLDLGTSEIPSDQRVLIEPAKSSGKSIYDFKN